MIKIIELFTEDELWRCIISEAFNCEILSMQVSVITSSDIRMRVMKKIIRVGHFLIKTECLHVLEFLIEAQIFFPLNAFKSN